MKCVETHLKYLSSIASSVRRIPARLWNSSQIKVVSCTKHKYSFIHLILFKILYLVDNDVINDTITSVENQCKEEKLASRCKFDVTDVLYQFVSLHMPRIVDVLNFKLSVNK